jgi:hypothetical protein
MWRAEASTSTGCAANTRNVRRYRNVNEYVRRRTNNGDDGDCESDVDENQPTNESGSEHGEECDRSVEMESENDDFGGGNGMEIENDVIGGGYMTDENDELVAAEEPEAGAEGGAGNEVGDEVQLEEEELGVGAGAGVDSSDDGEGSDNEDEVVEVDLEDAGLQWWFLKYRNKISRQMGDDLLAILKRLYDPTLPTDMRTLEPKIDRSQVLMNVSADGFFRYAHFQTRIVLTHLFRGLKIRDFPNQTADLWLSIDGVTFTESTRNQNDLWPVQARVSNVAGLEEELVYIGIHHGGKPVAEELMSDFFQDLRDFEEEPLYLEDGNTVDLRVAKVIADSPARDMLKCIMAHNSTYGCERCECKGVPWGIGLMTFTSRYDPETIPLRTDERFRTGAQLEHHKRELILHDTGRGRRRIERRVVSVFERECPNLDMVFDFVLESMHLCYLCAGKRFINYLCEKTKHGAPPMKIRGAELYELNERHYDYGPFCPREFARKPKQLTGSGSALKAAHIRQWLHYTGVPLFVGRVAQNVEETFLMFHCALRILSDPAAITDEGMLDRAQWCMGQFVAMSKHHFGPHFVSFSIHSMLHMTDEVRHHKLTLEQMSAFLNENSYRHLKTNIRSGNKPVEQIIGALLKKMAFEKKWWPGGVRQKNAGRRTLQFKQKRKVEEQNAEGSRHGALITREAHYICDREADSYCEVTENGKTVHIKCDHFVDGGGDANRYVEGRLLRVERQEEAYRIPMRASRLGIFLDSGISDEIRHWPIQSIKRKLYRLPFSAENRHVLIPLLHKALPDYFDL